MSEQHPQPAKRRQLNIPVIKGVVMLGLGACFAFLAALTGISPQIAAVPMIVFLLGFQPAKAQGTALAYSLCTGIGGAAGATAAGMSLDYLAAFMIAFGATIGAVFAGKRAAGPNAKRLMQMGQTLATLLALFVLMQAFRQRMGGPQTFPLEFLVANRAVGALVVGLAAGVFTQFFQVTTGIIVVPALIFLAGLRMADAIATSVIVFGIASLLPTIGYMARQAVDKGPGYWMSVGGILGGIAGGALLGRLGFDSYIPLAAFGLAAMLLSGWTLSRLSS